MYPEDSFRAPVSMGVFTVLPNETPDVPSLPSTSLWGSCITGLVGGTLSVLKIGKYGRVLTNHDRGDSEEPTRH